MKSIVLPPNEGRSYPMERISALFKADGDETDRRYSISEWTMSVLVGGRHDFENRSRARAAILNLSIPSGFEKDVPAIAQWFAENPPKDARP